VNAFSPGGHVGQGRGERHPAIAPATLNARSLAAAVTGCRIRDQAADTATR
jgi:hypothetical protein